MTGPLAGSPTRCYHRRLGRGFRWPPPGRAAHRLSGQSGQRLQCVPSAPRRVPKAEVACGLREVTAQGAAGRTDSHLQRGAVRRTESRGQDRSPGPASWRPGLRWAHAARTGEPRPGRDPRVYPPGLASLVAAVSHVCASAPRRGLSTCPGLCSRRQQAQGTAAPRPVALAASPGL